MAPKTRPPKPSRQAKGGAKKSKKRGRSAAGKSSTGLPLGVMLAGLVALAVILTAGAAILVSSTEGAGSARSIVETDLAGSQAVHTAFQQQRYQRLNLISRIFTTDQVLTSYLAEAAQARDEAAILASVEEYQNLLTFDLAVVMDRDGTVLTRTDSRSGGEELADTPLVAVALEESKASGVWQQGDQLYHAVAVPLVRQFELVGYIAVAYAINNTLAIQVERAGGAETVFLASSPTGPAVAATTLDDRQAAELIDSLRKAGDVLARVMERGETATDIELQLGGEDWTAFLSPLRDAGGSSVGSVVALTSTADKLAAFERIRLRTALAGLAALLAGVMLSLLLAKGAQGPISRVAKAVDRVGQGQWDVAMPRVSGDAGRISAVLREHLGQLREKSALEFVAGRVARLLPEPAQGSASSKAQTAQACLVGVELKRFAEAKLSYDPEENVQRFARDVQRVTMSITSQQGRVASVFGHRILAVFEGDNATYRALCAAAEILLTLSERDSVFDEPNPPGVALASGPVVAGTVPVAGQQGAVLAGVTVQQLEGLMREASAPGGLYFTRQVYQELARLFQQGQVEVKGQRSLLAPDPLYFIDSDSAARATGAQAIAETTSQVSGEVRSLADLRQGMLLAGRFDLLAEIGSGRMGAVWKAQDRDLGDLVTLKMLRPEVVQDALQFERLKRAVAKARSIRHANVLSVLDFGEADHMPYIEMEYARGMTLAYVLESARQMPVVAGVRMIRQIAWGLAAAHDQQLMHGGLKPENILIETAGGGVRVMDFGLGQPVRPGVEVARPGFLAPEQLEGQEPDSRADFFSLGAVAYHALTGHLPYPGATVGEVRQTLSTRALEAPTVHVAEIPPRLEAVLMKCLAVQPDQRYASIGDLLADLDLVEV